MQFLVLNNLNKIINFMIPNNLMILIINSLLKKLIKIKANSLVNNYNIN